MSKFAHPALTAALAFCFFTASYPATAQVKSNVLDTLFPDPVVATGKGFQIKRNLLDDQFITYQTEMEGRAPSAAARAQVESSILAQRLEIESNILQHTIINKIENQKATDDEKNAVRARVEKQIEDYKKAAPSEQAFQDELKASGSTLDQIRTRALEEQLGKTVLIRELVTSNIADDDAIKKFYDANPQQWVIPERVRIAQILISTTDPVTKGPLSPAQKAAKLKLAGDVRAQATNGGDFASLAKKYSDDITTKDSGGEYPPFARGMISPALEPVEAAAFTLQTTNQISFPVETQVGYHILKLLEKLPVSAVDLTNASPKIKEYLIDTEVNKQLPAFVTKINADYDVKTADLSSASATPVLTPPAPSTSPTNLPTPVQK